MAQYAVYRVSDGSVVGRGQTPDENLDALIDPTGHTRIELVTPEFYELLQFNLNRYRLVDGAFVLKPQTPSANANLSVIKAKALSNIDKQAEKARMAFLTDGVGQSMEYQVTEIEAKAVVNAVASGHTVSETDFPFLAAEQNAYAANGVSKTLLEVAEEVANLADLWALVGATIKTIRRTAKLKVEAATSPSEVADVMAEITWPTPGMV